MTEEKPIYRQTAPPEATRNETLCASGVLLLVCAVLLRIASLFPYSAISSLMVLFLFSMAIYAVLKKEVFSVTYVLYEDRLVYLRRYGMLEKETEVFPLNEAKFYKDHIEHRNKRYPFHPDGELRGKLSGGGVDVD